MSHLQYALAAMRVDAAPLSSHVGLEEKDHRSNSNDRGGHHSSDAANCYVRHRIFV